MPVAINWSEYIGKRFGSLIITQDAGIVEGIRRISAICDCGNVRNFRFQDIKCKKTTSCGCVRRKMVAEKNMTHGLSNTDIYKVWMGMVDRCYNENHIGYKNYGGRGIVICTEWRNDFNAFNDWSIANGYKRGLHIDRIDNSKGYSPDNCRFCTPLENARNKRINKMITFNSRTHCISEWAEITGLSRHKISTRIGRLKWSAERTLTTP